MPTLISDKQFHLLKGFTHTEKSFGIFLISDGYASEDDFDRDCELLFSNEQLGRLAPLDVLANGLLTDLTNINVWAYYNEAGAGSSLAIGTQPYDPQAATTPMGAYYQLGQAGQRGQFQLDYTKVVQQLTDVRIWANETYSFVSLLAADVQYLRGVIIILSPAVPAGYGNTTFGGNDLLSLEYEHLATDAENLYFVAASCNAGIERVVARALGTKLGQLGDESEFQVGVPTFENGIDLDRHPNLIYAPVQSPQVLNLTKEKWGTLTASPISVHFKASATQAPPDTNIGPLKRPDAEVVMWEGGGGYSNGVYRPAQDCLMRQRIGQGSYLRASQHDFCPVCRIALTQVLKGDYSVKRVADAVTLAKQLSEYNKITWAHIETFDAENLAPASFTIGKDDPAFNFARYYPQAGSDKLPDAFWSYNCSLTGGLQLTNVVVRQSQYYGVNNKPTASARTDTRDVFSSLSFKNLRATFSDAPNDFYDFDLDEYIRLNRYTLHKARRGSVGVDELYQTGFRLIIKEHLRSDLPLMEIELSVVMRGPASDFDPGGVPLALKTYPQIQFKWSKRPGVNKVVKSFAGTVRIVANPKHFHYETPMSGMAMGASNFHAHTLRNDASCFADSNSSVDYSGSETIMKRPDVEVVVASLAKPTWATVFDYYYPHIVTNDPGNREREFVAVHGPLAGNQAKARKMYVRHLVESGPDKYHDMFITKYPRQGGYDNIHVTGYMGKHTGFAEQAAIQRNLLAIYNAQGGASQDSYPYEHYPGQLDVADIAAEDVVAAPFCGTDCFHMHWRWSLLSDSIANTPGLYQFYRITPANYRGWSATASHVDLGAPLIPPNQELRIRFEALTSPSTTPNIKYR
jgi:hypothetical protein